MTDPTELRRLAEAATPGGWTASGTIVWSPDAKSVVAAASATESSSGLVEYERPKLSGIIQPSRNAAYIAAMHPETTLALLDRLARAETLVADARRFRWVASLDHGGTREIRLSGVKRNGDAWSHGISWNRTSDHADIRAAIDAEMKEQGND